MELWAGVIFTSFHRHREDAGLRSLAFLLFLYLLFLHIPFVVFILQSSVLPAELSKDELNFLLYIRNF